VCVYICLFIYLFIYLFKEQEVVGRTGPRPETVLISYPDERKSALGCYKYSPARPSAMGRCLLGLHRFSSSTRISLSPLSARSSAFPWSSFPGGGGGAGCARAAAPFATSSPCLRRQGVTRCALPLLFFSCCAKRSTPNPNVKLLVVVGPDPIAAYSPPWNSIVSCFLGEG
jgi:hypothetical protein